MGEEHKLDNLLDMFANLSNFIGMPFVSIEKKINS